MHFFKHKDFSFEKTSETTSTLTGLSFPGIKKDRENRRNNNTATLIIPIFDNEGRRVTKIKGSAFTNAYIKEIQGGWNNVEEIGDRAFAYCRLEAIPRFWDNVRIIGNHAFANQQENKELRIPPRWSLVEKIGDYAFSDSKVHTIPPVWNQVKTIGRGAFSFNEIETVPGFWDEVKKAGDFAFLRNKIQVLPAKSRKKGISKIVFLQNPGAPKTGWQKVIEYSSAGEYWTS